MANKTTTLYRYLTGVDDASFCERVTFELSKGWQLYGAPTLCFDTLQQRTICGQAIIKDVDAELYSKDKKLSDY